MRAVILAAGFGNRMMPLTQDKHKCLLNIAGRPVLQRIVDSLVQNEITDLTIVTGYRASELKEFMSSHYPDLSVSWVHNNKYETTNNIHSLSLALETISGEDVILIECDLVYDPSIITKLLQCQFDATALVSRYEPGMDGTVVSLSGDAITAIHPPHLQGQDFNFADKYKTLNIYKFSSRFVDESLSKLTTFYAKYVNNNCYYELVMGVMIYMQSSQIYAAVVDTKLWSEVDDPIDMQTTEYKFNYDTRLAQLDTTYGAFWSYQIEDFCYVQNAYFPPEGMDSMMRHLLPTLVKSFGSSQKMLDRKLSYFLSCDETKLVLLNGSSQIFPWLKHYLKGKKVAVPEPTFGEYPRAFPDANCYTDKVGIRLAGVEQMVAENDVIVIVNPNNPTGSILDSDSIFQLVKANPAKMFIIDESFIDFSDQKPLLDMLKGGDSCKNALIIKSLGKSLGVPGLRLGFVFSNNLELLESIRADLPIWNINSIAEYFLELVLKNRRHLEASFDLVKRARHVLSEQLAAVSFVEEVYPSQANFLLARLNPKMCPTDGLADELIKKHGIYIKDASAKFNSSNQYFRFAVRRGESNQLLIQALNSVASGNLLVAT